MSLAGYDVLLNDVNEDALAQAMAHIDKNMERQVSRDKISAEDKAAAIGRIITTSALPDHLASDGAVTPPMPTRVPNFQYKPGIQARSVLFCRVTTKPLEGLNANTPRSTREISSIAAKTRPSSKYRPEAQTMFGNAKVPLSLPDKQSADNGNDDFEKQPVRRA